LSVAFVWQLYTIWILVRLHESVAGIRYSRYLHLAMAAFGRCKETEIIIIIIINLKKF